MLSTETRAALEQAKHKSAARIALESAITPEMRFENGRSTRPLTHAQATLLASVRRQVSAMVGINARYLDAANIQARYLQLLKPRPHPIAA